MGTLPQLAIVKGQQTVKALIPALLHRTFEENVDKFCGNDTALIFDGEFCKVIELQSNSINYTQLFILRLTHIKMLNRT